MIRTLDYLFALVGLICLTPVFLIVYLLGKRDTGQPIFRQERVGKDKKPFTLIKFRTMPVETVSVATHLVDARAVTKLGVFLRKTKLDELPQLINVLKGEMSLVGPRPCLFNQVDVIAARDARGVTTVLPGITGLAQINGVDMSTPDKLAQMDSEMITTFSLKAYFAYILQTAIGRGAGDRVKKSNS
ncbi:sugar transferase [Photobacterium nomapromontoriensis]|uniref:sugar transferase n=1 Tax=Photobacterium nomapromontoriensis TaxID=2910237 RepID=UPI003D09AF75